MKQRFFRPRVDTGPNTVLHLKLHDGPNWTTTGPVYNAFDYSLNSHPGGLKGTAHYKYPGVDFDGDSDYIEVADSADFTPAGTAISISAWCYMDDATSFVIASKGVYNSDDGEWGLRTGAGDKISFRVIDESVPSRIGRLYDTAITTPCQGKWSHWVATYNGGTVSATSVRLYLNGLRVDDVDSETDASNFVEVEDGAHAVWIGRYEDTYANGKIDDVLIYTKVLTAVQVKDIYNLQRHRYQT